MQPPTRRGPSRVFKAPKTCKARRWRPNRTNRNKHGIRTSARAYQDALGDLLDRALGTQSVLHCLLEHDAKERWNDVAHARTPSGFGDVRREERQLVERKPDERGALEGVGVDLLDLEQERGEEEALELHQYGTKEITRAL